MMSVPGYLFYFVDLSTLTVGVVDPSSLPLCFLFPPSSLAFIDCRIPNTFFANS